jgi:preprotein translocase subunit SecA
MSPEDKVPIENGLISKQIEGAQKKVEGRNFDARKHVLQYDDVMNQQRGGIYSQRRMVLEGENISGLIMDMLKSVAEGIVELSKAGAYTIGQDEETSYVYGMPKAAAATGCLDHVAPLPQIPAMVARLLTAPQKSVVAVR